MKYEHHIFLSYAHGELWTPWVKEVFLRKLQFYLESEVGRLEVSVDYQIQAGTLWGPNLERRVARSKLMLALMSANYFHREWCRREMALMFEREKHLKLEGRDKNYGLLIPIRLGDGNTFPELIKKVQHFDFEEFLDPDLPVGSERASKFNMGMKELAQTIARTLPQAPRSCNDAWRHFTGKKYLRQLCAKRLPKPQPSRLIV